MRRMFSFLFGDRCREGSASWPVCGLHPRGCPEESQGQQPPLGGGNYTLGAPQHLGMIPDFRTWICLGSQRQQGHRLNKAVAPPRFTSGSRQAGLAVTGVFF